MKPDGQVIVRDKKPTKEESIPIPALNHSRSRAVVPSSSGLKSEVNIPGSAPASMRKVNSAHFGSAASTKQSKTTLYAAVDISYANSKSNMSKPAWCPGHARSKLFDTEPYTSVIHPAKFEQTPFHKFKARMLHQGHQDFYTYVGHLNRPFMPLKNSHFEEKPPRTFFNHLKAEYDFFKEKSVGQKRAATAQESSKWRLPKAKDRQSASGKFRVQTSSRLASQNQVSLAH